ncbi:hypothetical protein BDW75DRAFT_154776 [Aspergillus navahoensis]
MGMWEEQTVTTDTRGEQLLRWTNASQSRKLIGRVEDAKEAKRSKFRKQETKGRGGRARRRRGQDETGQDRLKPRMGHSSGASKTKMKKEKRGIIFPTRSWFSGGVW